MLTRAQPDIYSALRELGIQELGRSIGMALRAAHLEGVGEEEPLYEPDEQRENLSLLIESIREGLG